jgi:hypothetical protein
MSIIYINPFQFAAAPPSGYDPDAQAYITAVEAADGQSLETAVKDAINAFVVGCKSDGIWTAIKDSCLMRGPRTLTGALVTLKGTPSPIVVGTPFVAGDYNRKVGLTSSVANKALISSRRINDDPQDNSHISLYAASAVGLYPMGTLSGSVAGAMHIVDGRGRCRTTSISGPLGAINAGTLRGMSRSNSASSDGLFNGVVTSFAFTSQAAFANWYYAIFGTGTDVRTADRYATGTISFYSIGESLDLALLDARVSTLMSDLAAAIP